MTNIQVEINKAVSKELSDLVDKGFQDKRDPYGKKWKITKKGHEFDPNDSIRKSVKVTASKDSVDFTSSLPYTKYHQTGTKNLPQRMMFPDGELPRTWSNSLEKIIDNLMEKEILGDE